VEALSRCAENCFLNGISHRVRFVLGFASAQADQQLDFYTVGTDSAGSRYPGHARTASSKGCVSSVQTKTIDHVLMEIRLVPDLVKIDIEGAEAEALEGAKGLARNGKPRVIVEMHSPPELSMVENCRRVLAWCREVGYRAYYLKEHAQITTPDPIAHRGRCHLLLIPEQAEYPHWLNQIHQNSSVQEGMSAFQTGQK
jgi:FkbM family methyltransferase